MKQPAQTSPAIALVLLAWMPSACAAPAGLPPAAIGAPLAAAEPQTPPAPPGRVPTSTAEGLLAPQPQRVPSLDVGVIAPLVARYAGALDRCRPHVSMLEPTAPVWVTLIFIVDDEGRVRRPRLVGCSAPDPSPALRACLQVAVAEWVFPVPDDQQVVGVQQQFELGARSTSAGPTAVLSEVR